MRQNNILKWFLGLVLLSLYSSKVLSQDCFEDKKHVMFIEVSSEKYRYLAHISIPVVSSKRDSAILVMPTTVLYYKIYEPKGITRENFANFTYLKLHRKENLHLDSADFEMLREYMITKSDAQLFANKNFEQLRDEYSTKILEPRVIKIRGETEPNYYDRCVFHNFFVNGYIVDVLDEPGEYFIIEGGWLSLYNFNTYVESKTGEVFK